MNYSSETFDIVILLCVCVANTRSWGMIFSRQGVILGVATSNISALSTKGRHIILGKATFSPTIPFIFHQLTGQVLS